MQSDDRMECYVVWFYYVHTCIGEKRYCGKNTIWSDCKLCVVNDLDVTWILMRTYKWKIVYLCFLI